MTGTPQNQLERLLQLDITQELLAAMGKNAWQLLYLSADAPDEHLGIWCALLDDEAAAKAMKHDGWDLLIGDGKPGFSQSWPEGKEITTYHRFSSGDGLRPLVIYRYFHGAFPKYFELDQEFRLYHDLAEDEERGLLFAFDRSGREIEVVRINSNKIAAQLKYLRQFQAGTRFHLAIFVDSTRYSQLTLADVPAAEQRRSHVDGGLRWHRVVAKCDFKEPYATFSRVLGKVILPPPPLESAGIWPFEDADDQAVNFIIGIDSEGRSVEHTSDPDVPDNYFGANPGAAHYLTPVFFRREVLGKYFAEPERYTVADGQLTCLGLWSCRIDNDLEKHVAVFLGDLGRDLPFEERLHWRQFNVPPAGRISETNFRRSFLAQFTDPKAVDLTFRHEYAEVARDWEKAQGWRLFLPPSAGDAHLLDTVRVPVTNSQVELDEQIAHLTKLLIDSLNENEIAARAGTIPEGTKGIGKLALFMELTKFPERESVIQFLRDLQALRSTGSAHRKGSGYDKIMAKLGVDVARKPDMVRRLLEEATAALTAMRRFYIR